MLKPIATPNMEEFQKMAKATRQFAKKAGIKKSDADEAIKTVRKRARRNRI